MTNQETMEILKAVSNITKDISETTGSDYYSVTVNISGDYCNVKFLGVIVWSNETDERLYDEEKDEYTETFESCIRRSINEEVHYISKIAL